MNTEQKNKIGEFLKHIYCNNISVLFTDFDNEKQRDSVSAFINVLKEKAGNDNSPEST